jgi:hypothetical protein
MNLQQWVKELNAEISRLTKIRDLILSSGDGVVSNLPAAISAAVAKPAAAAPAPSGRGRYQMSEAVKAKLRAAAKKRWAAIKAAKK